MDTRNCEQTIWMRAYRKVRGKQVPSDRDALLYTPFHLYSKYHQFPVTVVLHLILILFISINAILISQQYIGFGRANEQTFEAIFLPDQVRDSGLYDVPSTIDLIERTVNNYYTFPVVSVSRYAHIVDEQYLHGEKHYKIQPVLLTLYQYQNLSGEFWDLPCSVVNNTHNSTDSSNSVSSIEEVPDTTVDYDTTDTGDSGLFQDSSQISSESPFTVTGFSSVYLNFTSDPVEDEIDVYEISGDFDIITNNYNLTFQDPLGPFKSSLTTCQLQQFFYQITQMKLSFSYQAVNVGPISTIPYVWDVEVILYLQGGQVTPTIRITHRIMNVLGFSSGDIFSMLNGTQFLLAMLCFGFSCNSIVKNTRIFLRTRRKYLYYQNAAQPCDHFPSWHTLPIKVLFRFFNLWSAFNASGCLLLMASSVAAILEQWGYSTFTVYLTLFGLGSMFACLNILRYFEYFPKLYLHVQTLRTGSFHVLTYCISVIPVFWAFAIFGVLNFGPYSEKFSSVGQTIVTLFSLLNGDDIYSTFSEIEHGQFPSHWISRFYIIAFVTLFVTSVLNVFIFIIEDSYRTAKFTAEEGRRKWNTSPSVISEKGGIQDNDLSSIEILHIIFYNIDLWKSRMDTNPEFYGLVSDPPPNFHNAAYLPGDESSYELVPLEEFQVSSNGEEDLKDNDNSKDKEKEKEKENGAHVVNLPVPLIRIGTDPSSLRRKSASEIANANQVQDAVERCSGESIKLIKLLQAQIVHQREYFEKELKKKAEELEQLHYEFNEQQADIAKLCQLLAGSLAHPQ